LVSPAISHSIDCSTPLSSSSSSSSSSLSSRVGTIGQEVASVPSGFCLSPPYELPRYKSFSYCSNTKAYSVRRDSDGAPQLIFFLKSSSFKIQSLFFGPPVCGRHCPTRGQARLEIRIYSLAISFFAFTILLDRLLSD
jgi:hypothetical protein